MTASPESPVPNHVAEFLATPGVFATIATIDPDGAPRQAVVWYLVGSDGRITLNSRDGRRWPANLRRDGRVSLAFADPADGYRFVAATGAVEEVVDDQAVAQADIATMARRYHAADPETAERLVRAFETQHRVSFRIRITALHDHLS